MLVVLDAGVLGAATRGRAEVTPVCIVEDCKELGVDRGMCALHSWYLRIFLADDYWRTHEPPEEHEVAHLMAKQGALL